MNEENIYIDYENLENIVKLLNVYIKEEDSIINEYQKCNTTVNDNYISKNSYLLKQHLYDNYNSLKTMLENHKSNIYLINKRIDNVKNKISKLKSIDDSTKIDRII